MKALCSYFDLFDKQLQYCQFYKYQFIKFGLLTVSLDFWITKEMKTKGNEENRNFLGFQIVGIRIWLWSLETEEEVLHDQVTSA